MSSRATFQVIKVYPSRIASRQSDIKRGLSQKQGLGDHP